LIALHNSRDILELILLLIGRIKGNELSVNNHTVTRMAGGFSRMVFDLGMEMDDFVSLNQARMT